MALQLPKEAPGLSKDCLFRGLMARWKKGVLPACYVTRRGDRPQEDEGRSMRVEGQGAQQWALSSREGPSVKCVFLQFEKVESAQSGVPLSSDRMSYVTNGGL